MSNYYITLFIISDIKVKRKPDFIKEVIPIPRYNFKEDFDSLTKARGWKTFEPNKKENNKMTILEMLNKANTNGRTYYYEDMRYNEKYGFHDCYGEPWESKYFDSVNAIFEGDNWLELDPEDDVDYITPMSIEEIEEELGYKIKIVAKN